MFVRENQLGSVFFFLMAISLVLLPLSGFCLRAECPSINVKIQNISNSGVVACAIFELKKVFLINLQNSHPK
jgi:hypothetical protein